MTRYGIRNPSTLAVDIVFDTSGYPGWPVVGEVPGALDGKPVRWDDDAEAFVEIGMPLPELTWLQFNLLFTLVERTAIRSSADPVVEDFYELARGANGISLVHPMTIAGVQYLESEGLIGIGRAAEVLAGLSPA